jgi:hypothetical protein
MTDNSFRIKGVSGSTQTGTYMELVEPKLVPVVPPWFHPSGTDLTSLFIYI